MQAQSIDAQQAHGRQSQWIGPMRRARREHALASRSAARRQHLGTPAGIPVEPVRSPRSAPSRPGPRWHVRGCGPGTVRSLPRHRPRPPGAVLRPFAAKPVRTIPMGSSVRLVRSRFMLPQMISCVCHDHARRTQGQWPAQGRLLHRRRMGCCGQWRAHCQCTTLPPARSSPRSPAPALPKPVARLPPPPRRFRHGPRARPVIARCCCAAGST